MFSELIPELLESNKSNILKRQISLFRRSLIDDEKVRLGLISLLGPCWVDMDNIYDCANYLVYLSRKYGFETHLHDILRNFMVILARQQQTSNTRWATNQLTSASNLTARVHEIDKITLGPNQDIYELLELASWRDVFSSTLKRNFQMMRQDAIRLGDLRKLDERLSESRDLTRLYLRPKNGKQLRRGKTFRTRHTDPRGARGVGLPVGKTKLDMDIDELLAQFESTTDQITTETATAEAPTLSSTSEPSSDTQKPSTTKLSSGSVPGNSEPHNSSRGTSSSVSTPGRPGFKRSRTGEHRSVIFSR